MRVINSLLIACLFLMIIAFSPPGNASPGTKVPGITAFVLSGPEKPAAVLETVCIKNVCTISATLPEMYKPWPLEGKHLKYPIIKSGTTHKKSSCRIKRAKFLIPNSKIG